MEDMEDIKKSLDFLWEEITAVRTQQKGILELFEEVKALRIGNAEKDKKIQRLEERVADLVQHSRMNDIVVTGLPIKPRLYAHAARAENREMEEQDNTPVEQQVATFLRTKGIDLDISNIEECHNIPRKNVKDKPIVILKFVNRKHKTALLKQGKKLKGSNVYLNEHLTKSNADIVKKARYLRKQQKIQNTWTMNCKVYIKLNGTPEEAKTIVIRNMEDLDKYDWNMDKVGLWNDSHTHLVGP